GTARRKPGSPHPTMGRRRGIARPRIARARVSAPTTGRLAGGTVIRNDTARPKPDSPHRTMGRRRDTAHLRIVRARVSARTTGRLAGGTATCNDTARLRTTRLRPGRVRVSTHREVIAHRPRAQALPVTARHATLRVTALRVVVVGEEAATALRVVVEEEVAAEVGLQ